MIGGLLVLFAYALGSLPMGLWIAKKVKGKDFDIRDWGSGNIGATNVLRVLGWKVGLPVFLADFLKGYLPAFLAFNLAGMEWGLAAMAAAVLGHAFSLVMYLYEGRFSGGKSVATAFGGLVALQPVIALSAFGIFLIVLGTTRYLSLGSMLGAVSAFVLAVTLYKGPFWILTLLMLALFILYTHRRNITNLLTGQEHKFGKSFAVHGEESGVRTAFVVHSITEDDLGQSAFTRWLLNLKRRGTISERTLRWLVAHAPVFKAGEITGIVDATGKPATVVILGIPMLPDQITAPENKPVVESLLKAAVIHAQRMGATVDGLGALLSTAAKGGSELQKWAKERRLTITIDSGGAFTAAATIEALRQVVGDLTQKRIAVVGASGMIGHAVVKYLSRCLKPEQLMAFGRTKARVDELKGFAGLLGIDELKTSLSRADVIILATSAKEPILVPENAFLLNQGAVLLDIAVPADVDDRILIERPDLKLVRCGLIRLPGQAQSNVDFHFGSVWGEDDIQHQLFPACLAQGLILARTGAYENASQSVRITPEVMDWFMNMASHFGYQVIASATDERGIFSGRRAIDGS